MSARFRYGRGPVRTGKGASKRARVSVVGRSGRAKLAAARARMARPVTRTRIVAGEVKGMDTPINLAPSNVLTTTNTNGGSFVLNLVQMGNGSWNRVGRKIRMTSLRLRGCFQANLDDTAATAPLQTLTGRMTLVYDAQPSSGAIPAFDVIFGRTVQDGTESCQFLDPLRYDNMGRFKVVRDWVHVFSANSIASGGGAGGNDTWYFDEFIELNNIETIFSGQSNPMTIADISTGALYLFFRADTNTGGTAQAEVRTYSVARLRFTD